MKIFSLGKFDKKLLLCLLFYLIVTTIMRLIKLYLSSLENYSINFSLERLLDMGCCVFFIIPEYIKRKRNKIKERKISEKEQDKINYNYTPPKTIGCKRIIFLITYIMFYCIFLYVIFICLSIFKEQTFIISGEGTKSLKIVYLMVLYKLFEKSEFYRHQYSSMIVIILMSIIRFIMNIHKYNWEFIFSDILISIFMAFLSPLLDMVLLFMMKYYMKYYYYSPYLICFILGIVFLIIESLALIIFQYIDCGETEFCKILSEKTVITNYLTTVNI